MQVTTKIGRGIHCYKGIQINPKNCEDIKTVCENSCMAQELFQERSAIIQRTGKEEYTDSFKQLLSVVGQCTRWGIVRKEVCIIDVWQGN